MRRCKIWMILVLSVSLCFTLQACSVQKSPVLYAKNDAWEVNGNSFSVTEVEVVDSYTPDSGEPVTATDGNKLLVISCDVRLSGEVKVGAMRLHWEIMEFSTDRPKAGPFETNGRTDYVFSVPQDLVEDETALGFNLDVTLRDGDQTRTGHFVLRETK